MFFTKLGLFLPFFFFFAWRWSRWLAYLQQKEYRVDRFWRFLQSTQGRQELKKLLPKPIELTRTGWKRPVITARLLVAVVLNILLWLGIASLFFNHSLVVFCLGLLAVYVLVPIVVFVSAWPTAIASAAITWWMLYRAQQLLRRAHPFIIGVGGSYGKTSTKHLLAHVLKEKSEVFVTPKSHNTKYSVAKSICDEYHGQPIAILEYGAYTKGEIAYLSKWFPPNLVIETGFTLQHMALFGSVENSLHAEAELVAALTEKDVVFVNGADEGALKIVEIGQKTSHAHVISYAGPTATIHLVNPQLDNEGHLSFQLDGQQVKTGLVGEHYLPNVQAAVAVAQRLELSKEQIIHALSTFIPSSSFFRSFVLPNKGVFLDDGGTSNPIGFEAALQLANQLMYSHKYLLTAGIVDLGEAADELHQKLAAKSSKIFEQVWYMGEDGKKQFKESFETRLLSDQSQFASWITTLPSGTLILLEGRIPKMIEAQLRALVSDMEGDGQASLQ